MVNLSKALEVCKQHVASWGEVSEESCTINKLVGLSNKVYLIETEFDVSPKRIIYRVFGSDEVIDSKKTSKIFNSLSELGVAPRIYGETDSVRLEEYLEGTRHIDRDEYIQVEFARKVGNALRSFHAVDMKESLNNSVSTPSKLADNWRKLAEVNLRSCVTRQEEIAEALEFLDSKYFEMLKDIEPSNSPIVFSHLDTHPLNILYKEDTEDVHIIDYDFAEYAYRAYDLGILFADLKFDYTHPVYPFYTYTPEFLPSDEIVAEYVKSYGADQEMWAEVKRCQIAADYFWGIWALAMYDEADNSVMDYLNFGVVRLKDFFSSYCLYVEMGGNEALLRKALPFFNQ